MNRLPIFPPFSYCKHNMVTLCFMIIVLILSNSSKGLKTTCEIPSVEAGENATLTTYFDEDLSKAATIVFIVWHQKHNSTDSEMLSCRFNNGIAECDKTPCCSWERQVTEVFRVYIHNISQELEGKFWGLVTPAEGKEQKYCIFSLKASTCSTDFINITNSHMNCKNRTLVIGQTCTVVCNHGHYYQENQTSVTYTCYGKNKWSPEVSVTSCEVYSCSTNSINASNSHMNCSDQSVSIGQTCTVRCISGHYYRENQTSITYTCVGKNKWSPEMTVISCEGVVWEQQIDQNTHEMYFLFLMLFSFGIPVIVVILVKRQSNKRKKTRTMVTEEGPLLPLQARETEFKQSTADYWLQCIKYWYPEIQSQTYFFPPLYCNPVSSDVENLAENRTHATQGYDEHGRRVLQRVLQCLRALADNPQQKEVMMILSQLQFGMHLDKPSYVAAALVSPHSTMFEQVCQQHYDQGDSDILIIHRKLGLMILEIKCLGENFSQLEMTGQGQEDAVMKKVNEAVQELNKAENVLKQLVSDIVKIEHITKIIVLPNITSSHLLRAINKTPSDWQALSQCLGVQSVDDAVKLCLVSDQLSDKQKSSDANGNFLQALNAWWQHVVSTSLPPPLMTSSYEQIVARIGGPVTLIHCVISPSLNLKSHGEPVSAIGGRVYKLVLFPVQVDILNKSLTRAFLSGPPGTGKTIVLIMQGFTWLQRGYDVHVLSTRHKSRAAAIVIERQLQELLKMSTARSHVHQHQFNFETDGEVESAVKHLEHVTKGRQLCVIADEAVNDVGKSFTKFCDQIIDRVPEVYIWGASVYHGVRPPCLEDIKLRTPLRSPTVVVKEVMESREIQSQKVLDYTFTEVPVRTDGPPVIRIEHSEDKLGHTGKWPRGCVECGHEVARVLTELNVGQTVNNDGPPSLQYRDVLVLCVDHSIDDMVDSNGQKITKATGLVRGLHNCKVPLRVVEKGDETALCDMALGVYNMVTVASWDDVHGLERKVVVVESGNDWFYERLYAMSRCTLQLVVIQYEPVR